MLNWRTRLRHSNKDIQTIQTSFICNERSTPSLGNILTNATNVWQHCMTFLTPLPCPGLLTFPEKRLPDSLDLSSRSFAMHKGNELCCTWVLIICQNHSSANYNLEVEKIGVLWLHCLSWLYCLPFDGKEKGAVALEIVEWALLYTKIMKNFRLTNSHSEKFSND